MNLNRRRALFYGVAAAPILMVLGRCAGTPSTSQLATDVGLIASGLAAAIAAVAAIPGVPAATVTQLQGYLATIQADAKAVAAATATAATGTVQEIVSAVQALAPIALSFVPGGSAVVAIVNAALSLLPSILAAIGVAGVSTVKAVYSPDSARLILRAAPVM